MLIRQAGSSRKKKRVGYAGLGTRNTLESAVKPHGLFVSWLKITCSHFHIQQPLGDRRLCVWWIVCPAGSPHDHCKHYFRFLPDVKSLRQVFMKEKGTYIYHFSRQLFLCMISHHL
jgi:hypothetical protein